MKRDHLRMNLEQTPGFGTGLYTEKVYQLASVLFGDGEVDLLTCGEKPRLICRDLDVRAFGRYFVEPALGASSALGAGRTGLVVYVGLDGEVVLKKTTKGLPPFISNDASVMRTWLACCLKLLAAVVEQELLNGCGWLAKLKHILTLGTDIPRQEFELRRTVEVAGEKHAISFTTTLDEIRRISSVLAGTLVDEEITGVALNPMEQMRETMLQLQFDKIYEKRGKDGYAKELLDFYHENFPEVEDWQIARSYCLVIWPSDNL